MATASRVLLNRKRLIADLARECGEYVAKEREMLTKIDAHRMELIDVALRVLNEFADAKLPADFEGAVAFWDQMYDVHESIDALHGLLVDEKIHRQALYYLTSSTAELMILRRKYILELMATYAKQSESDEVILTKTGVKMTDEQMLEYVTSAKKITKFVLYCIYICQANVGLIQRVIEDLKDKELGSRVIRRASLATATPMPAIPLGDFEPRAGDDSAAVNVLDSSGPNPMRYSLRYLVGPEADEYAIRPPKEKGLSRVTGLNKKLLRKYDTMSLLPTDGPAPAPLTSAGDPALPTLETIDGGRTYREISPKIWDVSTRPMRYNELALARALDAITDPQADYITNQYAEYKAAMLPSAPIKQSIMAKLADSFRAAWDKLGGAPTPEDFRTIAVERATASAAVYGTLWRTQPNAETTVTFILRVDQIVDQFARQLVASFAAKKPPAALFADFAGVQLRERAEQYYRDIVQDAVDELDANNVWVTSDKTLKEFAIGA